MRKVIALIFMSTFSLMFLAIAQKLEQKEPKTSNLRLTQIAGKELFALKKCIECHTVAAEAEDELTPVPNKREDEWFKEHVQAESEIVLSEAKSKRKQRRVLKNEIAALTDFLFESKAEEKQQVIGLQENIAQGAYLAYQNNCLGCHKIAGAGKEVGPDLTHVADEHGDKEWLIKNLKDPQQFAPESPMPKFDKLPEESLGQIADYLLTLKK